MRLRTACVFVSAFLVFAVNARCDIIDKVAIVINDEIITEGEIDRLMMPVYERYRVKYKDEALIKKLDEARFQIMESLIEDRLLFSEAKRQNVVVDDKDVEQKIDDAAAKIGSREAFEKALAAEKIALKDLKQRYREQLMVKRLIDEKAGSRISMNPVEVTNYYNAHLKEFAQPEEISARNILIKKTPNALKKLELAKEIDRRLREGGDMAALAKVYSEGPGASEGGQMGFVKRGDLMPEIEKAIFNLKAGETSGMIQTSLGYHFFKIEERRDPRSLSFQEVRRHVEDALYREKLNRKIKEFVDGLKKNAYIAFK